MSSKNWRTSRRQNTWRQLKSAVNSSQLSLALTTIVLIFLFTPLHYHHHLLQNILSTWYFQTTFSRRCLPHCSPLLWNKFWSKEASFPSIGFGPLIQFSFQLHASLLKMYHRRLFKGIDCNVRGRKPFAPAPDVGRRPRCSCWRRDGGESPVSSHTIPYLWGRWSSDGRLRVLMEEPRSWPYGEEIWSITCW